MNLFISYFFPLPSVKYARQNTFKTEYDLNTKLTQSDIQTTLYMMRIRLPF